jgi:hypothetical protein
MELNTKLGMAYAGRRAIPQLAYHLS